MFRLKENNTTVKTEILSGLITFLTMAYIVVVNPIILADAGVPIDQVFIATIISAVVGTLWLALCANYPIAIAPGMGLNAYFTYAVVLGSDGKIDYMTAFGAVFVAGLIFVILSLTPLREKIITAIPENLKLAITAGIGLFIAFVGLRMSGIVEATGDSNIIGLGDLTSEPVILTIVGLFITIILMALNVPGACFIGFAIGESLGASALRVAGGIFTKIADIGSDLMKIQFGIKEDDPRNPGVIAVNLTDPPSL